MSYGLLRLMSYGFHGKGLLAHDLVDERNGKCLCPELAQGDKAQQTKGGQSVGLCRKSTFQSQVAPHSTAQQEGQEAAQTQNV